MTFSLRQESTAKTKIKMIKNYIEKSYGVSKSFRNAAFFSVLFNALAKGVYFLFILLIGRVLGANQETDVYFFTISIVTVFVGFSNLVNTDVLIPRIIYLKNKDEYKLKEVLSFFYTIYIGLSILLTISILLFPHFFLGIFSKFKSNVVTTDYLIFSLLFLTLIFNILIGLQSSILIAYNNFVIPPLVAFLANCLSLFLFFSFRHSMGIYAAIMGLIVGGLVTNLVLAFYLAKRYRLKVKLSLKIDVSIFKSLEWVTLLYIAFSVYSFGLVYLFTTTFEGTLTAYNNAQLIAFIPYQFIAVQLGTILSNKFAEFYNTGQFETLKRYIRLTLIVMTAIILPICLLTIFFSGTIAHKIANFKLNDEAYITKLRNLILCFAIPAYMNSVYFCAIRLYTSILKVKFTSIVQSVICLVLLVTDYIGLKYFNLTGFYIANIFSYSLMFLISIIMIRNFFKIINERQAEMAANSNENEKKLSFIEA